MGVSRWSAMAAAWLAWGAGGAGAQQPAGAGEAALDSVDRYVRAELARQRIPGMSIAVLRGDSIVLARGYGYANLEHRVPATDSTIYQSGSVGKQFTSAAVVSLAREGKLSYDDPIAKHLREAPRAWRKVTIRHLLTHTSGIPDYTDDLVDFRKDYTEDELARVYARLPLQFQPGATWSYSNTGYALLGIIIHRVSGQFYGDYLRDRVFQPLGMRTARVISERDLVRNRAAGYELAADSVVNQTWVSPSLNTTGDGALYLTVLDMAAWAVGLNHARIPDSAGLAESWTPVELNDGGTYPYGFGWSVEEQRGRQRIGHTGSWQGFKSSIQRYPEFDLTVIAMANLDAAQPGAVTFGVAGILEPELGAPHLLAPSDSGPPEPIEKLLSGVAAGQASAKLAPGLRTFASKSVREEWAPSVATGRRWESLGCDDVTGRGISRLGARVARICYGRMTGPHGGLLASVAYTADWKAAFLDAYAY